MGNIPLLADEEYYGVAILTHQGQETAYPADNVQAAVDAAVDGDVIVLSPGKFKEITLNKLVRLEKHSGGNSITVNLDFPENSVISNSLLSGNFHVIVKSNIQSIYFSECNLSLRSDDGGNIGILKFDRCNVQSFYYNSCSVNTLEANNSRCYGLYNGQNTSTTSKFVNCEIRRTFDVAGATFENCILYADDDVKTIDNCTLTNCLYDSEKITIGDKSQANGCYNMSTSEWNDSRENLREKGFLGTDGTVVGPYGGQTPYTGTDLKVGPHIWSNGNLKYQDGKLTGTYYINPTH